MKILNGFLLCFIATLSLALADDTMTKKSAAPGAVAVFQTTSAYTSQKKLDGTLHFTETGDGVRIQGTISGLEPNSVHGFHIHQFGDLTKSDGTSAGGHFNPGGHDHAAPHSDSKHAGDLGNIKADQSGMVKIDQTVKKLKLSKGDHAILGRALVIHAKADDLKSQPSGDAGPRIAVAIIGWAEKKSEAKKK